MFRITSEERTAPFAARVRNSPSDPLTFKKFQEMLTCARKGAPRLFEAPVSEGHHLGIEALVNLSRFRSAHIRPAIHWTGTSSSWRPAVSSLAHHLICEYRVPAFLAASWHTTDSAADKKRGWFVAHSRGASFRSLDLPIAMFRWDIHERESAVLDF